jgi:hypothetical protein
MTVMAFLRGWSRSIIDVGMMAPSSVGHIEAMPAMRPAPVDVENVAGLFQRGVERCVGFWLSQCGRA